MTNTPVNLDQFFGQFDQPLQAVVECTSYWYWVADWCSEEKIPLQLAHAKILKAISYAKVKTDSVDARTLADLLRAGLIPEAHKCRREQRDLRELTRGRLRMIERRSRLQSSLWQLAAIIAYTHYPAVKEFYKKVTRRSGKHVARAVVGKELAS